MLDRIKKIVKWLIGQGLAENQEGIGELLGYTNKSSFSQLLNGKKPLPADFIDRLCKLDRKVNKVWITTGIGEMLNNSSSYKNGNEVIIDITKEDNIQYSIKELHEPSNSEYQIPNDGTYRLVPLINSDAVGGMHTINDISYTDEEYIKTYIPFTDALSGDVCIQVTSDSMSPTCPAGCVVQIREVSNWQEYFGFGSIFVIQLKDGRRIIKEVTRYDENPKDYVLCVSHNKDVPAEELPKGFIISVWKVIKILNNRGW